jgi:hypothetical protein
MIPISGPRDIIVIGHMCHALVGFTAFVGAGGSLRIGHATRLK